jgi:hypothetical protein
MDLDGKTLVILRLMEVGILVLGALELLLLTERHRMAKAIRTVGVKRSRLKLWLDLKDWRVASTYCSF